MADRKKLAIGLGVTAGIGALIYAVTRVKAAPPPPPPGAVFTASNLVIEPAEPYVGEKVSISATVTNIGTEAGEYEVICEIVGVTVLTGRGFLGPGESEMGTLHFTPTEPRSYQVLLNGLVGSFVAIERPIPQVTVYLKNPPSGANKWQMLVIDWDFTKSISWGVLAHDNIGEPAIFDIPPGWKLPLKVSIGIYEEWQENGEWHARQLYRVQSYHPNEDYRELFLRYGDYYFNVATEQFEAAPPPPTVGFTVKIRNAPPESEYWWIWFVDFNGVVYDPGRMLSLGETWSCPADATGEGGPGRINDGLMIEVATGPPYYITHSKYCVGPVYNKDYVYDCSTGVLSVV